MAVPYADPHQKRRRGAGLRSSAFMTDTSTVGALTDSTSLKIGSGWPALQVRVEHCAGSTLIYSAPRDA